MSKKEVKNKHELSSKSGKKKVNTRTKGHSAERKYARIFREKFDFSFCKTSRQVSRILDDSQIDLANIPLNVQIKKGYYVNRPKADVIFKQMRDNLNKNFPPEDRIHQYPKILIHDLDGAGEESILVTMTWEKWAEMYKNNLEYLKIKGENGRNSSSSNGNNEKT